MKHAYVDLFIPIKIKLYNFAQVFKSNIRKRICTVYRDRNSDATCLIIFTYFRNILQIFLLRFHFVSAISFYKITLKRKKCNQNLQLKLYEIFFILEYTKFSFIKLEECKKEMRSKIFFLFF